jgi:hypothetical protein
MSTKQHVVLYTFAAALLAAFTLSSPLAAQQSPQHIGIVDDWSTHHLGFSNPGTFQDAEANGTVDRWLRIVNDPRYQMQRMKQTRENTTLQLQDPVAPLDSGLSVGAGASKTVPPPPKPIHQDWSMTLGSGARVGVGQYPAKFSFDTTHAFCDSDPFPDFVVYNTNLVGTGTPGTQPTIIAYDNLYSGCSGANKPLIFWQYNTGTTTSLIPTSVSLSLDGSQVVFIQRTGSVASIVLLKWAKSGTITTPTSVATSAFGSCTAPCMTSVTLSGSPNITRSAVYVDYFNGFAYVGDDSGKLHKFVHVFDNGTLAEVGTPWPVTVSNGNILSGPVWDSSTNNVFVGSSSPQLHYVNASTGALTSSGSLGVGVGVYDAPLLDASAARAYVSNGSTGTGNCNGNDCKVTLYQFTTSFPATNGGSAVNLGIGDNNTIILDGAFDNNYWNSPNQTGSFYICGDRTPQLYQVAINTNVLGSAIAGPKMSGTSDAGCSPVTEFFNNGVDRIFISVQTGATTGAPINCPASAGCVMSFDVTSSAGFGTSKTTSAVAQEAGGTSAIVVDNSVSNPAGTSEVYFSTLSNQTCAGNGVTGNGTGGCAIQATQAALN